MLRVLLPLVALAVLATGCTGMVDITPVGEIALDAPAQTSTLTAADGSVLAELHAEQDRELVSLDRVPQALQDAVVAVEDERFYAHAGIDARAVARALVANIRSGEVVEGGSTITQQLAKNAIVGGEQTIDRKLTEASVAWQLEQRLSKDEILEQYLNTVYFGHGAYGVATAAQRYFDAEIDELVLAESALLAALLQAPTRSDPHAHPEQAIDRRNRVLERMRTLALIDEQAAADATAAPLELASAERAEGWKAPYFVDHALRELQHAPEFAALGDDPVERADQLFRGGLEIETTLDPAWQAAAEDAVAETLDHADDPHGALVAIDPETGDIGALIGGRDYDDPDDPTARFNLATRGARQPGSAFKPLVLAAALAQGHTLEETFPADSPLTLDLPEQVEPWTVRNYDDTDYGELSLTDATAFSVNTVYAQLVAEVGADAVADMARRAGVRRELAPLPALALGTQEVSPLELASVQATLAAGGRYREPTAVTRITDPDGTVLYERDEPIGEQLIDAGVAWLVTTALEGVVSRGTGERADLQRPTAGKTGTSQSGADAWFAGYTPDMAAAVWIGFPEGRVAMEPPRTRIRVEGGTWPAEIFARFGLTALVDVPANEFPVPDLALDTVEVDVTRNCLPNPYTPPEVIAERSYIEGTAPTELCREPTGPPSADVPDVTGLPAHQAVTLLERAGFEVERRNEESVELPPGYVVRQEPEAGSAQTLDDGYVASVWVSTTEGSTTPVPDVLNEPHDEARQVLEDAGFIVETTHACPGGGDDCTGARERPGRVWEQSPDAGADTPRAAVIELSVYPGS